MNEREKLFNKDTISFYYDNNYYDQDLVWIFNPMYGNCLQINMESILKVEKYKQNSLHIELMFKDIVELRSITKKDFNGLQYNSFLLFVSGTKSNPFVEQKNVFLYGTDNIETEIKISKTVFNKQKKTIFKL